LPFLCFALIRPLSQSILYSPISAIWGFAFTQLQSWPIKRGRGFWGQGNRFTCNVFSKFGLDSPWGSEMIAKLLHSFAFVLINFLMALSFSVFLF